MKKQIIVKASTTDTTVDIDVPDYTPVITVNQTPVPPVVIPPSGSKVFLLSFPQVVGDYMRKAIEKWNGEWAVDVYAGKKSPDNYYRFQWYEFEAGKNVYDFTSFDNEIKKVIDDGGQLSFGIMTCYPDAPSGRRVDYSSGGYGAYPEYLNKEMKAFQLSSGCYVPDWNSEAYLSGLERLNTAINNHLNTSSYKGVKLKDAINCIDIRGFGAWGEWHTSGLDGSAIPTAATLQRIVDSYVKILTDYSLVAMIAALDGGSTGWGVFPSPASVAYYLLTAKNNWGEIGWRRDSWDANDTYYPVILENNKITYNGKALKDLILNKWKTAPVTGEPMNGAPTSLLVSQIKMFHASSFGNGNFGVSLTSAQAQIVKDAAAAAGCRLTITGGSVTSGANGSITLNWSQQQAPTYEDWRVVFQVNGTIIGISAFNPKLFIGSNKFTDNLPNIPAGKLTILITDPKGYRKPMTLGITGQNPDGSYTLTTIN